MTRDDDADAGTTGESADAGTPAETADGVGDRESADAGTADEGVPEGAPDAIHDRVRERAETIARREREDALRKLEAKGGLTPGQREAVEDLTRGIVDGLLEAPERTLREADDREQLRAALRLFGDED